VHRCALYCLSPFHRLQQDHHQHTHMATVCICTLLFGGANWVHILLSAIAQHLLAWLWYEGIFSSIFAYYFAADKGVKRAEHARVHYSHTFCVFGTFIAGVARALTIYALVKNLGLTTAYQYQEAAILVAAAIGIGYHHSFWGQRPFPLLAVNGGFELGASLLGALVLFLLVGVNFF
jgi:hypothetical protein